MIDTVNTCTNFTDFVGKLEHLLALPEHSLSTGTPLTQLSGWDSLAILEFMMLASCEYGAEVDPSDIAACTTVDDLAALVFADRSDPARIAA